MKSRRQNGYLIIAAAIIIVVVAFIAATVVYMSIGTTTTSNQQRLSKKAFYLAESGLERGLYALTSENISCANINTTFPNAIQITPTSGEFQISAVQYNGATTLSSGIGAGDTTIPLASSTGFASQGRVTIGSEIIDYSGISGNSLTGAQRGMSGSTPTAHSTGASVTQDQCTLTSNGAYPNFTNPKAQHQVVTNLQQSFGDVWVVGNGGEIWHWKASTQTWIVEKDAITKDMNDVHLYNSSLGFAVGEDGVIYQYQNGNWTAVPSSTSKDLSKVHIVSPTVAWAVGEDGTIIKWTGSWNAVTSPTTKDLNSVSFTTDGSFGFAVGEDGEIIKYQSGSWTTVVSPTSKDLNDVIVLSSTQAYAVGDKAGSKATILVWNGGTWSKINKHFSHNLYSIDISNGVGLTCGQGGWCLSFPGWSSIHPPGGAIYGLAVLPNGTIWAVGQGNNRVKYNDGIWHNVTPTNDKFFAVSYMEEGGLSRIKWVEQYN